MSEKKNLIKNYIYNLSYKILAILLPLITTPYISRVLKSEAIGEYSFTLSFATFFSIFGIMGLNLYGQLQISKNRDDRESLSRCFWEILAAKSVTSVLAGIIYYCIICCLGNHQVLYRIMLIVLVANIVDISWLFQGLENFKKVVIRNYCVKLLTLILIFSFVKKTEDLYLYAIIVQGSTLIGNFLFWYKLFEYIDPVKVALGSVFLHIKNSFVYFIPTIATTIYTSTDKLMIGFLLNSNYQNGIYDQAHKIEEVAVTVTSSLGIVLLPRISFLHEKGSTEQAKSYIYKSLQYIGVILVPMAVGLFSVSDVFIPLFLGNDFLGSIPIFRIFCIMLIFSGLNTIIGNSCLVAQGLQKDYNLGVCAGAIVNIILNLIFINLFQSLGAAVASAISELAVFMVFIRKCPYETVSFLNIVGAWKKYIISSTIMGVLVYCVHFLNINSILLLGIQIFGGVCFYCISLLLLRDQAVLNILKDLNKKLHNRGVFQKNHYRR